MFECGGYGDALSIEVSGSVVKLYCGKPHHFTFTTINAVFLGECHVSCNYKTFFEYFEREKRVAALCPFLLSQWHLKMT
jgi:hypothetical protein